MKRRFPTAPADPPTRSALLAWGMVECKAADCRTLIEASVAAEQGGRCSSCLRRWRETQFQRRERARR